MSPQVLDMEMTLNSRMAEVLNAVVRIYIETGEPVASRTIAHARRDNLSPATIRNIMADLADLGFLSQPHTSAGRIPTAKAFKHFAKTVAASRSLANELSRLRDELYQLKTAEDRAEYSSHLLTEMTHNMGIVAAVATSGLELDQVELVLLPDMRVLMIVVTRDGSIRNQVALLDEPVTQDELHSIRNYVNRNFSGWSLPSARAELRRRFEFESAAYDRVLRQLTRLYQKGLLDIDFSPAVFVEGAANLVGLDLHLTKEKLRGLFRALEEKKRLMELLDQFIDAGSEELQVQVGLEKAHPSMKDLTLIGVTVHLQGGIETKMAVLGPMRMNYPKVVSAVAHVGEAIRSLPR